MNQKLCENGRDVDLDVAERFRALASTWKQETKLFSNVNKRAMHPAYQNIIGMGPPVVRCILLDLAEHGPNDWFWALTAITGENPISEEIAGNMQAMTEAWLQWGTTAGYLTTSTPATRQSFPT
ncbi:MAG TPA: hypothetical protein VFI31_21405 [Pirellulales bacterium]|nr:hypothetical protein [Pirellulales bacterium]